LDDRLRRESLHHALRTLQRLGVSGREDAFATIIRCTADPAKADKRTRSKWSRALRFVAAYKADSEPLDQFIKRKGGINECAARRRWSSLRPSAAFDELKDQFRRFRTGHHPADQRRR
jgi:hypothetical protein